MSGYNDNAEDELFDFMLEKPFNLKGLATVVKTIKDNKDAHL
jgi:hypothetical protein